ncbi:amidase domain-containing protein [Streptomyces roseoverticillatus]|uniref:amidase domain-containing protein n=1 Tax=Streptomyces roseoverticillatus TaxID=66429 RepID=UPI0027E51289|nr:amidase domain-containing protein [Streptomyces roseoverticillatus]MCF3104836.1 amidase domain-containing protein [Streptomyces roseoverticillatus]
MKSLTLRTVAGVVASLAVSAALVPASPAGATDRPGGVDKATAESFGRIASVLLTDRTAAVVDGKVTGHATLPSTKKAHLSSAMERSEKTVAASLHERKNQLKALGEAYSVGDTRVVVDRTGVDGRKATMRVTETTRLTYKKVRGDEPADTGFQAHHELSFAAGKGGAWELTGIKALDEMPQINAPAPEPAPALRAKAAAAGAGDMPNAPEASVWPFPKRLPKDTNTGLDYKAMADYAEKYWKNYNPAYRSHPLGTGGDCTNFVSQALKTGGWKHAPGRAGDYTKWWYGSDTESDSWTGVNEWSWFAQNSGRTKPLKYVYQMEVGDVLQADFDRDGSKDHTMLVTYRDSLGTPYLTYHSFDTYRRSMLSLSVMLPLTKWYAYRT